MSSQTEMIGNQRKTSNMEHRGETKQNEKLEENRLYREKTSKKFH